MFIIQASKYCKRSTFDDVMKKKIFPVSSQGGDFYSFFSRTPHKISAEVLYLIFRELEFCKL
jgi:hypothetical protein